MSHWKSGREMRRRDFFSASVKGAAAGWGVFSAMGARSVIGANDRIVLSLIGAGGRGCLLAGGFAGLPGVEFKHICDVNGLRGHDLIREIEGKQGYAPRRTSEMRDVFADKDVDAVVIATPEHWHALASIWALQAGKDVYVEKCPTLTIDEGRKMTEAVRKYDRILQIGTQNRSAAYGTTAREYIQSGRLGKVVDVKCYTMLDGGPWNSKPDQAVPKGLDWDCWLGPAPYVPYNPTRHIMAEKGRGWQQHWDYCGGQLADDGSHVLDLARMALGDPGHPGSVFCAGGRLAFKDARETPDTQIVVWDFGDFVMTMDCTECLPYTKKSPQDVRMGDKFPYWPQNATRIEIYGTRRMMYLGRHGGGWQVMEEDGKVVDQQFGRFPDEAHQRNFLECLATRKRPNGDVEQGHRSATLVHLGNISLRLGSKQLIFDPQQEVFTNSDEANRFLRREGRKHYRIPDKV